jgi:pyrroline-5-carboxylate reductase
MRVGFIGGGYMGEAMIAALLKQGIASPKDITVSDVAEARRETLRSQYGVNVTEDNAAAVKDKDLVVLAVKPQEFSNVASGLRGAFASGSTALTIMAGVPIERVSRELAHPAVVRAMPNTAAAVGQAMSVWAANDGVSEQGRANVRKLLGAMGRELFVEDEAYLDMATAVNGSGPGYVFLFLEAFIDAAIAVGLPRDVAEELCIQTLVGSAALARDTGKQPAELRVMVTSKGGTTAAGLQVLEDAGLRGMVKRAVAAARERAKELGG